MEKKLNILGYEYTVKRDISVNNGGYIAVCDPDKLEISLKIGRNAPRQLEDSALIHEVIEAGNSHLELSLDHSAIMALETLIYTFLARNGVDISCLLDGIDDDE